MPASPRKGHASPTQSRLTSGPSGGTVSRDASQREGSADGGSEGGDGAAGRDSTGQHSSATAAALAAVRPLQLTKPFATQAAPAIAAQKAWWAQLAEAAALHLSMLAEWRPVTPETWASSVREANPEAMASFRAIERLIDDLVSVWMQI